MTVANISSLPVDYSAALAAVGLRGNDPKAQAVVLVCQRYALDPILKHVVLVEGNVYVTRDGLLHIAHESGQLDGMEVDEAKLSEDGKEWLSRASVYRKDMGRAFSLSGRYPAGRKNSKEMAEKVAVARTLRHAFDVAIATEDERQAEQHQPERPRVTASQIVQQPAAIEADDRTGVVVDEPPAEDANGDALWPPVQEPGGAA